MAVIPAVTVPIKAPIAFSPVVAALFILDSPD